MARKSDSKIIFLLILNTLSNSKLLSTQSPSSSDMLFIRHGRSRVRHSNEKDHIRWGLQAFDNLTLDYEVTDTYDNDSFILFGSELWALDNASFTNQTDNVNQNSKPTKIQYERTTNQITEIPILTTTTVKRKLAKKKLMENIQKDVDKGIEYLKTHQNLNKGTLSMPRVKFENEFDSFSTINTEPEKTVQKISPTIKTDTTKPIDNLPQFLPSSRSVSQNAGRKDFTNRPRVYYNFEHQDSNNSITTELYLDVTSNQSTIRFLAENDVSSISENPYLVSSTSDDETAFTNVHATPDEELEELDEISRNNRINLLKGRDVVTKFLQIVESQHLLGANCTAGTALNLGEGVVDQYAQDRFRIEAEVAVNRANMLTRIFKLTSPSVQASEHLLHASVLSMVEFDDDIFAAGNCFDWNQHPLKGGLFCPFAYRLPPPDQGASFAKDLAAEYHYLGNTSEWFFLARKNAERVIAKNEQRIKAFHLYSNSTTREVDEILSVRYEDGRWSKPYYDCGGGNIWMLTYTVPFFGYENGSYFFKGTSGIDIDLRRVDIDQCPQRHSLGTTQPLNIFAGTDKCKQRTTMCEALPGLGFRRGSYKCVCRKGFYYPETTALQKYFNGSVLEEEYEKLMLGENSTYSRTQKYECLPCAEGCDYCEDASPCVAALNWPMRTSILILACTVIGLLPPAAWFTFRYQSIKVVRAASPALLRVIALGAFFIYCTNIVMYPNPSLYTCTARIWLREIGFSLTYGALMLKTWRISVIFRVRSAKAVKITDAALLKRLGVMCCVIGACLLVRTIVSPPQVVVGRTADDLKAFLCKTDWWDYTFTSMEVLFLAWGVRLCIMVRKAPSEFNESRFISMAIYNEFLLTCFLNVSMLFLQSPANPDLLYIIFFCHTQLTVTLLLGLIFGSKVYIVLRSGKGQENTIGMGAKASGTKFNFRPQIRTFANPSTATSSTVQLADTKLTEQEAQEELRQLSVQLQRIQQLAPPRGTAAVTISNLLDGLKTTSHQLQLKSLPTMATPILSMSDTQKTRKSPTGSNTADKSVNTDLTGEDFCKNIKIETNNCCSSSVRECEINTNIQANGQTSLPATEGKSCDLSFSDLQLQCMCAGVREEEGDISIINDRYLSLDRIDILKNHPTDLRDKRSNLESTSKTNNQKSYNSCNKIPSRPSTPKSCNNHKCNNYFVICSKCEQKIVSKSNELSLDSRSFYEDKTMSQDDISFHSVSKEDDRNYTTFKNISDDQIVAPVFGDVTRINNESNACLSKGKTSKSEKLVLDLNDRSKYTKEVSV